MKYKNLTQEEQIEFKKLCDAHYGNTIMKCETGEPLYLNEEGKMIDTQIIIDLIFDTNKN